MERLLEDFGQPSSKAQDAEGGVGKTSANESILVGSECIYFPDFANRSVSVLIHSVHALLNSRCITFCYCSLLTVCVLCVCLWLGLLHPFFFFLPFFSSSFLSVQFVLISFFFHFLQFNGKYIHQIFLTDAVFVTFFSYYFIYIFFPHLSLFPHYI